MTGEIRLKGRGERLQYIYCTKGNRINLGFCALTVFCKKFILHQLFKYKQVNINIIGI